MGREGSRRGALLVIFRTAALENASDAEQDKGADGPPGAQEQRPTGGLEHVGLHLAFLPGMRLQRDPYHDGKADEDGKHERSRSPDLPVLPPQLVP